VPFLFNARYFGEYYAVFPAVWISIAVARAVARTRAPRSVMALALALLLFPMGALRDVFARAPREEVGPFLEDVHAALAGAPRVRSIRIEARCGDERASAESAALLRTYHELSGRGDGVRWVTGLDPGVAIALEAPAELVLHFCERARPRISR
jgi:hypothetical protein